MTHTKGKWVLANEYSPKVLIGNQYNSGTDAEFVAYVSHPVQKIDKAIANAKLIAVAPELLEACKNLITAYMLDCKLPNVKTIHDANTVIKKATNKTEA